MERYDVPIDDIEDKVLDVALYDEDKLTKDDLMGKIRISLKPTMQRILIQRWYALANNERAAQRAMEASEAGAEGGTDTKTGEVEIALRLVYEPKCRVSYYDLEDPSDLERISRICVDAVEEQKDDPLKLLVVRCATCRHVFVDAARGITPCMVAAARPSATLTINLLYRLKCDLDQQDSAGRSAMHIAARYDSHRVVRVLAQLDGDVEICDKYGKQPIHYAAEMGNDTVLQTLFRLGACLNDQTHNGRTCVALAAQNGRVSTIKLLFELGADIDEPGTAFAGRRPLHFAAGAGEIACIKTLLRLGADVNHSDNQLNAAVHHAALNGHRDVVDILEELDADMDAENDDGLNARQLLAKNLKDAFMEDDLQSQGSFRNVGSNPPLPPLGR